MSASPDKLKPIRNTLQSCPLTHDARISRHNEFVTKISRAVRRREATVDVQLHVHYYDVICDVQISWEDSRTLSDTWKKKEKFQPNISKNPISVFMKSMYYIVGIK